MDTEDMPDMGALSDELPHLEEEENEEVGTEVDAVALAESLLQGSQAFDDPNIDVVAGGSPLTNEAERRVETYSIPALEEILENRVPTFIVHKGAQSHARIPEFIGVARQVSQGKIGLGVAIRLPKHRPHRALAFLDGCGEIPLKIADPEIFAIPGSGFPLASVAQYASDYLYGDSIPGSPSAAWVTQVFDAQRSAGATVLLSATGWVSDQRPSTELSNLKAWIMESRGAIGPEESMIVNITLPSTWLSNPTLRALLAGEIVESNEKIWYIRVYWPVVSPRYGQLSDSAILDGYKELAVTAALEDKTIFFPNSGLTGWIGVALGAAGFSSGISWPEQAFAQQRIFGSQPNIPRAPRRERFFDPTVIHMLDRTTHTGMHGIANQITCTCRYCSELNSPPWNHGTSGLHHLIRNAHLTTKLSGSNKRLAALREAKRADTFVSNLSGASALSGAARPVHLKEWIRVLT
jgi:hypothetical protein